MKRGSAIIAIVLLFSVAIVAVGCGKTDKYDVNANEAEEFLWENCFRQSLEGELISANHSCRDGYIWFYCFLPTDMTFEQVQPLLEEIKQNVLSVCASKSFEPYNTFMGDHHYTVYLELVNPQSSRPSSFARTAGQLTFRLGDFPISKDDGREVVRYY